MKFIIAFMCMLALGCGGKESTIDWLSQHNICNGNINIRLYSPTPLLLKKPEIHLVFWGSWWGTSGSSQMSDMITEWNILANDPNFYSGLSEYSIQDGRLIGTYSTNSNVASGSLSDSYIQTELQSEIDNNILPSTNSNSLYVIELPFGVHSQYDINNNFGGHHFYYNGLAFAVIEYGNFNIMSLATSHEIYESCTDTKGNGFNSGPGETEIADYCTKYIYNLDGYIIQMFWSQKKCQCIP